MSFRGGILIGTYSIARYCERHEILADDERTVIQCANTGFQLIMAGTLNVTAAYQRNMRKDRLPRTSLIQNATSHFRTCEVCITRLHEFRRCRFQTLAPDRHAVDQQINSFCILDQVRRVSRIAGEHERIDLSFEKEDVTGMTPDEDVSFTSLWVEDSLGRRYEVSGARDHLPKLFASMSQSNLTVEKDARNNGARPSP